MSTSAELIFDKTPNMGGWFSATQGTHERCSNLSSVPPRVRVTRFDHR
jgi:hypothetical protein